MKQIKNQQLIKVSNKIAIVNLIRAEGYISRAKIARRLQLSPTTVSDLVQEMIEEKLLFEAGNGDSNGGRRPILLSIDYSCAYILVADISFNGIKLAAYNLNFSRLELVEKKMALADMSSDAITHSIYQMIDEILNSERIDPAKVAGIVVGISGIKDPQRKIVIHDTSADFANLPIYEIIRKRYNFPVFVESRVQLSALCEKAFVPEYKDLSDLVCIEVEKGIGSGIIINNELYYGAFGLAGQIGHITTDINGKYCKCGNRGCVEVMANLDSVLKMAEEHLSQTKDETPFKRLAAREGLSIATIYKAAQAGDRGAQDLIRKESSFLAIVVLNVINTFNPQAIVIGGSIAEFADLMIKEIKSAIGNTLFKDAINRVILQTSQIKEDARLKGGALLLTNKIFENPYSFLKISVNEDR